MMVPWVMLAPRGRKYQIKSNQISLSTHINIYPMALVNNFPHQRLFHELQARVSQILLESAHRNVRRLQKKVRRLSIYFPRGVLCGGLHGMPLTQAYAFLDKGHEGVVYLFGTLHSAYPHGVEAPLLAFLGRRKIEVLDHITAICARTGPQIHDGANPCSRSCCVSCVRNASSKFTFIIAPSYFMTTSFILFFFYFFNLPIFYFKIVLNIDNLNFLTKT